MDPATGFKELSVGSQAGPAAALAGGGVVDTWARAALLACLAGLAYRQLSAR